MRIKTFLCVAAVLCFLKPCFSQSKDELEIRKILREQTESWNKGNLQEFMKGYWKNDSLMFIGSSGVTYGFDNTLNNYKRSYSDTTKMGKLKFEIIKVQKISADHYFVVGKWFLTRTIGDLKGHYTLLLRKMNGEWFIIADHSS